MSDRMHSTFKAQKVIELCTFSLENPVSKRKIEFFFALSPDDVHCTLQCGKCSAIFWLHSTINTQHKMRKGQAVYFLAVYEKCISCRIIGCYACKSSKNLHIKLRFQKHNKKCCQLILNLI